MAKKIRVLVTAGPTREMLDPVRFLSNVSTGQMGYELAKAAKRRGLDVTLISGPTLLKAPRGCHVISVLTAREMKTAISKVWARTDILIMTAAVCDYTPVRYSARKIRRIKQKAIRFKRTEDILQSMGRLKGGRLCVGFALETDHEVRNALRKMKAKNLDLIVLNRFGPGNNPFGRNRASMWLIGRDGRSRRLVRVSKTQAAGEILSDVLGLWQLSSRF